MSKGYYERKEQLAKLFSPKGYQQMIASWLEERQAILAGDGNVEKVRDHAFGEVDEIREELEKGDVVAQKMETLDYGWLIAGTMWANKIEVNDPDVAMYINGVGKRSDIYDRLAEAAGNLSEKNLEKDGHRALGLWFSALAGQEATDIQADIARVRLKNEKNYNRILFSGINPQTNQPWQGEMMSLAFDVPRKHVRTIRDHYVKDRGLVNRKDGLKTWDWLPYQPLIMAFTRAKSPEEAVQIATVTHAKLNELLKNNTHLEQAMLNRGAIDLSVRSGILYQAV
ncbi:MAG TPA: hypothetical protein VF209_04790 [Patescibacteria group bacterium]